MAKWVVVVASLSGHLAITCAMPCFVPFFLKKSDTSFLSPFGSIDVSDEAFSNDMHDPAHILKC